MKKIIYFLFLITFNGIAQENLFYYYHGDRVPLTENHKKILVKISGTADEKSIENLKSIEPFVLKDNEPMKGGYALFEGDATASKSQGNLSLNALKVNPVIISAYFLVTNNQTEVGYTDEFVVKLKEGKDYEDLLKIVRENNCQIKNENPFVKNQFMIQNGSSYHTIHSDISNAA